VNEDTTKSDGGDILEGLDISKGGGSGAEADIPKVGASSVDGDEKGSGLDPLSDSKTKWVFVGVTSRDTTKIPILCSVYSITFNCLAVRPQYSGSQNVKFRVDDSHGSFLKSSYFRLTTSWSLCS
jgi:hypothetical protein